jgi:hypothetical protein
LVEDESQLTAGRPGEGSHPWSAGAGCAALTTGLVQVAWVLRTVWRETSSSQPVPTFLAWEPFAAANRGLFLWEAFVAGAAHLNNHTAVARAAVEAFSHALPNPPEVNAILCASSVYSLVGAALLRTGWPADPGILQQPCLVVRAGEV